MVLLATEFHARLCMYVHSGLIWLYEYVCRSLLFFVAISLHCCIIHLSNIAQRKHVLYATVAHHYVAVTVVCFTFHTLAINRKRSGGCTQETFKFIHTTATLLFINNFTGYARWRQMRGALRHCIVEAMPLNLFIFYVSVQKFSNFIN